MGYYVEDVMPISGYGIYLNDVETQDCIQRVNESDDYCGDCNGVEDLRDLFDAVPLNYNVMCAEWYVMPLVGCDDFGEHPTGVFLFSGKQGSIFDGTDETYSSPDDMISDLKHDYGQFLPKGFDYRKHLAFVRAACL